jgi:hypothetical protein
MHGPQSPHSEHEALFLGSWAANLALPCNLAMLIWGIHTLLKPGGPRGEELVVVYWWVVPLVMATPAWVAIHSWLNHWALSKSQLILRNAPFALAVAVWAWVTLLPT